MTQKKLGHWDVIHRQAFDNVETTIARDATLAYPIYSKGFEIYTAFVITIGRIPKMVTKTSAFISIFNQRRPH